MKRPLLITVIFISSFLLGGCTPNTTNSTQVDTGSLSSTQEVDFDIEASHMRYDPSVINVKAGTTVTIRVTSVDEVHDFVIDELNVDTGLLGAGRSTIITFTVPEDAKGKTYEFYCSVGSHRAMGMVGSLVVN